MAGHDRDEVTLLIFPNEAACRDLDPSEVRRRLRESLASYNAAHAQSSTRVARAIVLPEPPSIDAGEITDKGYINQRAVLTRRAAEVERLHGDGHDPEVVRLA